MNWQVLEKCTVWHFPLLHYSGTNIHVGPIILLSRESFCIPLKPLNGDNSYLIIKGQGRGNTSVSSLCSIFFKKYLFIWLHWVLVAACRILAVAHRLSSCGVRNPRACGIWFLTTGWTHVPYITRQILNRWTTRDVLSGLTLLGGDVCLWKAQESSEVSPISFPKCL